MENEKTNEINIMDIVYIIRKNIIAIISVAVIMAVLAYVYTITLVTPLYRSSAHLLIKALTSDAMTVYSDSTSRLMLVNNCIEVLSGTEIMQSVVDELALDMSPEDLQNLITISSPADTQVLKINVIHPDPKTAKEIATKMVDKTEDVLARDVGVAALSTIQQPKIPINPISPNPLKNAVMGGFLGGFITAAIVLLIRFINNKIFTPEDVDRVLGLTVFSSIPEVVENTAVAKSDDKAASESKGV